MISAGESDMETDRISSLHTSCLGFAPLIFDLKEDQGHKVNFDLLMKACEPVWKAVEADKRLPQKLVRNKVPSIFYDSVKYTCCSWWMRTRATAIHILLFCLFCRSILLRVFKMGQLNGSNFKEIKLAVI